MGSVDITSPLTLTPHGTSKSVVVRIAGKPLGDGRIEVALQQSDATGNWSPLLLPATRILPTDAPVGEWQFSSALTVVTDPVRRRTPGSIRVSGIVWIVVVAAVGLAVVPLLPRMHGRL